jgi:hypothetical protein
MSDWGSSGRSGFDGGVGRVTSTLAVKVGVTFRCADAPRNILFRNFNT